MIAMGGPPRRHRGRGERRSLSPDGVGSPTCALRCLAKQTLDRLRYRRGEAGMLFSRVTARLECAAEKRTRASNGGGCRCRRSRGRRARERRRVVPLVRLETPPGTAHRRPRRSRLMGRRCRSALVVACRPRSGAAAGRGACPVAVHVSSPRGRAESCASPLNASRVPRGMDVDALGVARWPAARPEARRTLRSPWADGASTSRLRSSEGAIACDPGADDG
jgi:hypothetical protein